MTKKTFLVIKILTVMILSILTGVSVNLGNYILPIVALAAAGSFIYILSKRVKEVMADERDYKIAGQAARLAITIYSITMVIIGLWTLNLAKTQPDFEFASYAILYSTCALMILNAVLFKIYQKYGD